MNPLVKKEIRLLLPAWIAAMLLAIMPIWIAPVWSRVPPEVNLYVLLAFALGFLLLAIASFGQEFGLGTFAMLLSQPVERRRLWFVKTVVLAGAFVSVLLALLVSWTVHFNLYDFAHYYQRRPTAGLAPVSWTHLEGLALFAVVCFSGGLWTTLLLRRMLEAFWLTLLTPLAIMVTVYGFHEFFHWSNQTDNYVIPAILLLYSLAGFWGARRLLFRAQDVQWTGGEIAFPSRKRISARTTISSQPRHWFFALVWKELQLHQVNLLIAAVVLALNLVSVVIRRFHPYFANPNVLGLIELVWVLWLLMPMLIGSAAVAEERRLGVIESQLCLPVSRRAQFFIKIFAALLLSVILGGAMPFVIERARDFNLWIFVVAAAIFFISFYASTLARTTLQAIGLAIVVAIGIYFYAVATAVAILLPGHSFTDEQVGLELLKLYLGLPVLLFVFGWLIFWNFKWLHESRKLWRYNFILVFAAFAFISVCTHAVYFRAWEFLAPVEPPHGPARLTVSKPPKLLISDTAVSALLPDGRLWSEQIGCYNFDRISGRIVILPHLNTQQFIGGSNWVDVVADAYRIVAIQSDHSLWSVQTWHFGTPTYPLTRISSDTNWSQVAGEYGFLLLKKDQTLWCWGADGRSVSRNLRKYLATPPQRISDGTNWLEIFGHWARRNDGSVWALSFTNENTNVVSQLRQFPSKKEWMSFVSKASNGEWNIGVKTNSELWLLVDREDQKPEEIQLGRNAKWKAAAFAADNSVITLRSDGTLWEWPPLWNLTRNPGLVKPRQLGTYSGWITLHSIGYWLPDSVALAADGSLWVWKDPSDQNWLAPSRKPVYLGNIFTAR